MKTEKVARDRFKKPVENMTREHKLVFDWRVQEFINLGFKTEKAEKLAHTKLEVWGVRNLISKGCSRDLAIQILDGTDTTGQNDPSFPLKGDAAAS